MKKSKLISIFVCITVLLVSLLGFAFTTFAAEGDQSSIKSVNWTQGEGGIAVTDQFSGGVRIDVKEDATTIPDGGEYGNTVLSMISFKLSEPIDVTTAAEWDGFLIRIRNSSKNNLSFNAYLLSGGTQIGRNYNSSINRYEVFMDEDGQNYGAADTPSGIWTRSGYYILTGGLAGTWNYKFDDVIVNRANLNAVDEIMIGLRMGDNAMKGRGIVVESISVYKEAENGGEASVKTLFHADSLTVSEDAENTTAGINLADYDKGTIVNTARPPINNTGSFIAEEYRDEWKPVAKANLIITVLNQPSTVTEVEYRVTASGLQITDNLLGGVVMQTKEGMQLIPDDKGTYGNTILGEVKFNLSQTVDGTETSEWDGLLIRMKNTAPIPLKFNIHMLSGESIGRNYVSATVRSEVFIDENGENMAVAEEGINVATSFPTISANASGTWNYRFDDLKHNRPDMNAIEAVLIGLRMGEDTYENYGLIIGSIAAYKEDAESDTGYTVKTLFNAKDLVVSDTSGDSNADLNLADTDLGKIVTTNCPAVNNTANYVNEEYRAALHEIILGNLSLSIQGYEIWVNYLDETGNTIAPSATLQVSPDGSYNIQPIDIENYVYSSSSHPLSGVATENMEIDLTYVVDEQNPPRQVTEVEYSVTDEGLWIKDDLIGGVSMQTIEGMELIADDKNTYGKTILAMVQFNLSQFVDGTETSEWDGLLIRMKNTAGVPLKFNVHMLSGGAVGRNYVSADVRAEIFIDENGSNMANTGLGITTASGYPTISANASGTWNYRFDDLKHNRPDMNAIEAVLFGLRMGDKTYDGFGLVIGSIAVYKEDPASETGYTVKTLFNAKDLVISEDENDAAADLNLADTDLGKVVTTDCPAINNTGNFVDEEYRAMLHEKILKGLNIQQQGYEIRVNFLDEEGDAIASSVNLNVPINETYTITPKEITGYVFDSSDLPLTGTATGNMVINLTYKLQEFKITICFTDEAGNKIKEDVTQTAYLQEYITIDVDSFGEIDGYTYKECDGKLSFTVMRDETITLIYSENSAGANIPLIIGCVAGGVVLIGVAVVAFIVIKKKKRNNSE